MRRNAGRYERTSVGGEVVSAFIPEPLPPHNPPLAMDADFTDQLQRAESSLAQLELAGAMVPSPNWFIYSVESGVLVETTGRRRDRTYSYAAYLDRLRAGTEL